jgi:hypothetical protein
MELTRWGHTAEKLASVCGVADQWGPPVGAMLVLLGWNEGWLERGYGPRKGIWAQPVYSPFLLFYFIFYFYFLLYFKL